MAALIKDRKLAATDRWQRLEAAADGRPPAVPPAGDVIVPVALWLGERDALLARAGALGVCIEPHEDPAPLAGDLEHFGVIAVNFPKFADGRGYSIAQLLRTRYGWRGELRAVGDIFRDHLHFLSSCGFDSFELRPEEDPQEALAAFGDFSEAYQASVERPVPLFRRRVTAGPDGTIA